MVQHIAVTAGGVKKESGHLINGKIIDNKILVHTAQWYITHTCNLACKHCLSHNNFAISGHKDVKDNLEHAKAWNKLITIKDFTIVGGEVFTHNDLNTWVHGLRDVFTDIANFKVITNGTLLEKYAASFDSWFNKDVVIEVSIKRDRDKNTFVDFLKRYNKVEIKEHYLYDQAVYINGKLCFLVEFCTQHKPWAVKEYKNGLYKFWYNSSKLAHKDCWQKYCHYFYQGDLYKCGTIVGAKEFVKKYPVNSNDKSIYAGYNPIKHTDTDLLQRITDLNKHIPQCSRCPISSADTNLVLDNKKILP